jgi:outer membrane lipoprotein SlyB
MISKKEKKINARCRHRMHLIVAIFLLLLIIPVINACHPRYNQVVEEPAKTKVNESASAMTQVYFYPAKGQSTQQQSRDQYECYNWAISQTGFDPSLSSIAPVQRVRVVPMPPPGHDTIILSIAGAVLGALIGGPYHAAEGALIGAASGAITGAASDITREERARQMQEAYANRDEARNLQNERKASDFRRAMSACLIARGYTVN